MSIAQLTIENWVQKIKSYIIIYLRYHDADDDDEKTGVAFARVFISPGEISFKTDAPSKGRYLSALHEIPTTLGHCVFSKSVFFKQNLCISHIPKVHLSNLMLYIFIWDAVCVLCRKSHPLLIILMTMR